MLKAGFGSDVINFRLETVTLLLCVKAVVGLGVLLSHDKYLIVVLIRCGK